MALNIDYFVGFSIEGNSGKAKATNEKAKELANNSENFLLYTIKKSTKSTSLNYIQQIFLEIKYCFKYLFKKKPDIIFARTNFGLLLVVITRLFNTSLIFEVHSDFKDESQILYKNSFVLKKLSTLVNFLFVSALKYSDGIIFNNPDLESYYLESYQLEKTPTISIYNGSNTVEFYPEDKTHVRKKLNTHLKNDDLLFVFTGSVSQWHGIEYLIETFIELKTDFKHPGLYLYIVGGGSSQYRLDLKKRYDLKNGIQFVDEVSTDEARDFINAADVCMLPVAKIRVSQGSPLKLYDYIACGKAIITQSSVNGYSDVINEHDLGIDVDFYCPQNAANKIEKFIKEVDLNNFEKKNRKKALNELSWKMVIENWIRFASIKNNE